jgi:hypothetical protein
MAMKMQEVREGFMTRLAPHLEGFRGRKREGRFVRRYPGGSQQFGLAIVDYAPEFRVSLVFSVRLDAVQAILDEAMETPEKYRAMRMTTYTILEHFFPGEKVKQYSVRSEEDIQSAVDALAPLLRCRILPLFDGLKDIVSLEAVLNSDEGRSFDRTNPPGRQMVSLLLARLARNPRVGELAEAYRREAEAWDPRDRQKLVALIERLPAL